MKEQLIATASSGNDVVPDYDAFKLTDSAYLKSLAGGSEGIVSLGNLPGLTLSGQMAFAIYKDKLIVVINGGSVRLFDIKNNFVMTTSQANSAIATSMNYEGSNFHYDKYLYLGGSRSNISTTYRVDLETGVTIKLPVLPTAIRSSPIYVHNGRIWILGGLFANVVNRDKLYSIDLALTETSWTTHTYHTDTPLLNAANVPLGCTAFKVGDEFLFMGGAACGGGDGYGQSYSSILAINPDTLKTRYINLSKQYVHTYHKAVLLYNKHLWVAKDNYNAASNINVETGVFDELPLNITAPGIPTFHCIFAQCGGTILLGGNTASLYVWNPKVS